MPFQLVVVKGRSANKALRIPPDGVTTVGRQEGCQIRIGSSQVSRKHCELFEKKGLLLVKDLGSSNGTLVNGKKIEGQQVVEGGSILTIGSVVFRVEAVSGPAPAQPAAPGRPADTAVAQPIGPADEVDYEIEADSESAVPLEPVGAATGTGGEIPAAQVLDDEEASARAPIDEDDAVDFLLELDPDDKR